jgi:hypothetical protein
MFSIARSSPRARAVLKSVAGRISCSQSGVRLSPAAAFTLTLSAWTRLTPAAGIRPAGASMAISQPGVHMSNEKQAAQGSAATAKQKLTFKEMSGRQKTVFILKLVVSILSFGMIFPNLMSD